MDESGTPDVPGNTSHYVLVGVSVPVEKWKQCDKVIRTIKSKFDLIDEELHIAWIMRRYLEQSRIIGFEDLSFADRRNEVRKYRTADLLRLQRAGNRSQYLQTKKNYSKTEPYVHLTWTERLNLVRDVATALSKWSFARVFAECVDKVHFDPARSPNTIDEQAFEQVVSRFERYLQKSNPSLVRNGLLIHDNNETVAKRHTAMMKRFHATGTRWTQLHRVIETPLFVNSELTSMVQIADLCGYAIRRYLENQEDDLFGLVFKRADRAGTNVVGVRHFTNAACTCKICGGHRRLP